MRNYYTKFIAKALHGYNYMQINFESNGYLLKTYTQPMEHVILVMWNNHIHCRLNVMNP